VRRDPPSPRGRAGESAKADFVPFQRRVSNPANSNPANADGGRPADGHLDVVVIPRGPALGLA